jgi:predicted amidohydrolase YtcJ
VVQGAPLLGIHDLVNRRTGSGQPFTPAEALTVEEALRAYTYGSAYADHQEHDKGRLARGLLADLVVLGDDPARVDPAGIGSIEVVATVVGGVPVFGADDLHVV